MLYYYSYQWCPLYRVNDPAMQKPLVSLHGQALQSPSLVRGLET